MIYADRKANADVQNIEDEPLRADSQTQTDEVLTRATGQEQRLGSAPQSRVSHGLSQVFPAPLQKRISFTGWAAAALVSVGIWAVLIYLAVKLL